MPAGLKRFYGKGHLHFITFSCYRRLPLLKTVRARDVFVKELSKIRDEMGFRLAGYAVMPEHVHLLISEPKRKQRRSGSANQLRLPYAEGREPLRAFWQARFYDFNVYTRGKKKEKLTYMHANPVVRGLVEHPKDWRWSSWTSYWGGEAGMVRIDAGE